MYAVKYSNKADWLRNRNGRFKIGTLEQYRSSESVSFRLSDHREGIQRIMVGGSSGSVRNLTLPGGSYFGHISWQDCGAGILHETSHNEYIFCVSLGGYDREHHKIMLNGDDKGYPGNPELTHYVQIDLRLFDAALKKWAVKALGILREGQTTAYTFSKSVIYEGRDVEISPLTAQSMSTEAMKTNALIRAVFHKPQPFAAEKEFRICLRTGGEFSGLSSGAGPLFPSSRLFKKSVLHSGCISSKAHIPNRKTRRH